MVAVKNAGGRLGSGMLVRATLDLAGTFKGLAVSKDAVVRQGESTFVYTVAGGVANPVPVRTRATHGDHVAIEGDGLAVGQPIVVRGNERLFPGSPVREAEDALGGGR
jgi:multidrug efflux pump subunit AcrA (membrane-fusion protein)